MNLVAMQMRAAQIIQSPIACILPRSLDNTLSRCAFQVRCSSELNKHDSLEVNFMH